MSNIKPVALARPGVLSLTIKDKNALYAAYMPYIKGGGIFSPSSKPYKLGDEIFMLLTLMESKEKTNLNNQRLIKNSCSFSSNLFYPKYFPTMGTLLPAPNALEDTLITGAVCSRLNSFLFTIFRIRFTKFSSNPRAIISLGPCLFSIY